MNDLQYHLDKLENKGGSTADSLKAILQYLIEKDGDKEYVFKTNDETEFLYAFHGLDFLLCLWDLDQELRNKIKYSQDYNEDVKEGMKMAREMLWEIMEARNLNLDMLR